VNLRRSKKKGYERFSAAVAAGDATEWISHSDWEEGGRRRKRMRNPCSETNAKV
jgi:hypothetical protein